MAVILNDLDNSSPFELVILHETMISPRENWLPGGGLYFGISRHSEKSKPRTV